MAPPDEDGLTRVSLTGTGEACYVELWQQDCSPMARLFYAVAVWLSCERPACGQGGAPASSGGPGLAHYSMRAFPCRGVPEWPGAGTAVPGVPRGVRCHVYAPHGGAGGIVTPATVEPDPAGYPYCDNPRGMRWVASATPRVQAWWCSVCGERWWFTVMCPCPQPLLDELAGEAVARSLLRELITLSGEALGSLMGSCGHG
jgi:hypothetical protein